MLEVDDDFARSLAAYRIADVLLVNPIRDGMNLVAEEGPSSPTRLRPRAVSRGGRRRGADRRGRPDGEPVRHPATAEALNAALTMPVAERRRRTGLCASASGRSISSFSSW